METASWDVLTMDCHTEAAALKTATGNEAVVVRFALPASAQAGDATQVSTMPPPTQSRVIQQSDTVHYNATLARK